MKRSIISLLAILLFSAQFGLGQTILVINKDTTFTQDFVPHQSVNISEGVTVTIAAGVRFHLDNQNYNLLLLGGSLVLQESSHLILDGGYVGIQNSLNEIPGKLTGGLALIDCRAIGLQDNCSIDLEYCGLTETRIDGSKCSVNLEYNDFLYTYYSAKPMVGTTGSAVLIENSFITDEGVSPGSVEFFEAEKCVIIDCYFDRCGIKAGGRQDSKHMITNNEIENGFITIRENAELNHNTLIGSNISISPTAGTSGNSPMGKGVKVVDNTIIDPPYPSYGYQFAVNVSRTKDLEFSRNQIIGGDSNGKGIRMDNSSGLIANNLFLDLKLANSVHQDDGMLININNKDTIEQVIIADNQIRNCGFHESGIAKSFSLVWVRGNVSFLNNQFFDNTLFGRESHYRNEPLVWIDDKESAGTTINIIGNIFEGNNFLSTDYDTKTNSSGKLVYVKLRNSSLHFSNNVLKGDSFTLGFELDADLEGASDHDLITINGNVFQYNRIGLYTSGAPNCSDGNSFLENVDYHIKRSGFSNETLKALRNYWGTNNADLIDSKLYDDDEYAALKPIDFGEIVFENLELVLSPDNPDVKTYKTIELELEVKGSDGHGRSGKTIHFIIDNPDIGQISPGIASTNQDGMIIVTYKALKEGECRVKAVTEEFESNEITITNESGIDLDVELVNIDPETLLYSFIPGAKTKITLNIYYSLSESVGPGSVEASVYHCEGPPHTSHFLLNSISLTAEAGEKKMITTSMSFEVPWISYDEKDDEIVLEVSLVPKSGDALSGELSGWIDPSWHYIVRDFVTLRSAQSEYSGIFDSSKPFLNVDKSNRIAVGLSYYLAFQENMELPYLYILNCLDENNNVLSDYISGFAYQLPIDPDNSFWSKYGNSWIDKAMLFSLSIPGGNSGFDPNYINFPDGTKWATLEVGFMKGESIVIFYKEKFPVYKTIAEDQKEVAPGENNIDYSELGIPMGVYLYNHSDLTNNLNCQSFEGPFIPFISGDPLKEAMDFFQMKYFYTFSTGLDTSDYEAEVTLTYDPLNDFPEGMSCAEDSLMAAVWDTTMQQFIFIPTIRNPELNQIKFSLNDLNSTVVIGCSGQNLTWVPSTSVAELESVHVYPNPYSTSTTFRYPVSREGDVILRIYDLKGQLIQTIVEGHKTPGEHELIWDGTKAGHLKVGPGIYFYCLNTSNRVHTGKLVKMGR